MHDWSFPNRFSMNSPMPVYAFFMLGKVFFAELLFYSVRIIKHTHTNTQTKIHTRTNTYIYTHTHTHTHCLQCNYFSELFKNTIQSFFEKVLNPSNSKICLKKPSKIKNYRVAMFWHK